jgi:hypothetical protein
MAEFSLNPFRGLNEKTRKNLVFHRETSTWKSLEHSKSFGFLALPEFCILSPWGNQWA